MPLLPPVRTTPLTAREIRSYARKARLKPTLAERMVLVELRRRRKLSRFKFQYVIHPFYVDFCCLDGNLVVEIDGAVHNTLERRQKDWGRTQMLEKWGFKVLRFTNEEVAQDVQQVVETILKEIQ